MQGACVSLCTAYTCTVCAWAAALCSLCWCEQSVRMARAVCVCAHHHLRALPAARVHSVPRLCAQWGECACRVCSHYACMAAHVLSSTLALLDITTIAVTLRGFTSGQPMAAGVLVGPGSPAALQPHCPAVLQPHCPQHHCPAAPQPTWEQRSRPVSSRNCL